MDPSAENAWCVKTGGISWQWSLKPGFTVLSDCRSLSLPINKKSPKFSLTNFVLVGSFPLIEKKLFDFRKYCPAVFFMCVCVVVVG